MSAQEPSQGASLYVHVPFCVSKCAYCDFYSLPAASTDPGEGLAFRDAVLGVVERSAASVLTDVSTIYLGGGTPTALGLLLPGLARDILGSVGARDDVEITVETNPETSDAGLVAELVAAGVTRLSLGVQSFDDAVLATLGRCHDADTAWAAAAMLAACGVPFSLDLICGVPGQTDASWHRTLETALSTGAPHLSVYPLSIEEGTPIHRAIAEGGVPAPDPDAAADMMLAADRLLEAAGLVRYEVANYARPGFESRHNLGYWTGVPYVGVGPSAHSMLPMALARALEPASVWEPLLAGAPNDGRVRFCVNDTLDDFLRDQWRRSATSFELLSSRDAGREDLMLGLRLSRGVTDDQAQAVGAAGTLVTLEADGLVEHADGRWRTTRRGWLLGNEVFGRVWSADEGPCR
jgi:oxygen-independent coproporphyrinogen-3 oxidase